MVNNFAIKKGFTLLESSIVLMVIGVLLSAAIGNCTKFMDRAKFQATVREMGSIARAAIDYYHSHASTWPSGTLLLSGNEDSNDNNMAQVVSYNLFGKDHPYSLSFSNNAVTVTTTIPKGVLIDPNEGSFLDIVPGVKVDQISITRSIPNEFSGRLTYDLQYSEKQ